MPIRRLEDTLTATTATIAGEDIAASTIPVKPHIQPGVLQPAVAGKLLNGATHSGAYGTAQTQSGGDGHKYYYTDIKGSGPIKDPRIGAHFGSQRHMFKSKQLLEQETATHGSNTYSIDGRKWCRLVGSGWVIANTTYSAGSFQNDSCNDGTTEYFEVVAYCNALNFISYTASTYGKAKLISIDGSADTTTQEGFVTNTTPLADRYVDAGSVIALKTASLSLGIHTFRIGFVNNVVLYGIELIAQDTSNRSNIQIPSQNVVSYGKKFTVSGTPHYNPFDGLSGAKTLSELGTYIDTATSLGMENWKGGTSNYYKPFNGGRVIKWVASDGTIKTSVTMMPPNAQNINGTASNAVSDAHIIAGTNDDTINFDTTTIANATPLSEVAKTFHWREFGNGAANGGTGATYADASMLNSSDDIAYVMDDGLTSLSGDDLELKTNGSDRPIGVGMAGTSGDSMYLTFIGTGISNKGDTFGTGWTTIAQNLPYGTHILKIVRDADSDPDYTIDGISLVDVDNNTYGAFDETSFHQPKKPPIPEDAVVLADYMLMADHVKVSAAALEDGHVSKGTRLVSARRDIFYDNSTGNFSPYSSHGIKPGHPLSLRVHREGAFTAKLPFFGTTFMTWLEGHSSSGYDVHSATLGGSAANLTHVNNTGSALTGHGDMGTSTTSVNLGLTEVGFSIATHYNIYGIGVISPIHTSSHYQTFETPFLHELVGGDRNMEQTNLVVTSDGKTWDEVTRDTSYISKRFCVRADLVSHQSTAGALMIWTKRRGVSQTYNFNMNKNFAIAYDRDICLVPGLYFISFNMMTNDSQSGHSAQLIKINGTQVMAQTAVDADWYTALVQTTAFLHRGDYVQIYGAGKEGAECHYYIEKVD